MPLNLVLGLNMLLENPKPGVDSFSTSLIMLHEATGTTHRTISPQPLLCEAEVDKIHKEIFTNFLDSGEEVGVV